MLNTWQWIKSEFIQEIPDDIALCEYDCRKEQCTQEEWLTCGRRVSRQFAGVNRCPRSLPGSD